VVIGIDLGATNIHAGVIDEEGTIIEEEVKKAHYDIGKDAVIGQLIDIIQSFHHKFPTIKKAGFVCPGPMDIKEGVLLNLTNHSDWGVIPIVDILKDSTGLDITFDNDATGAALAEGWVGRAKDLSTFMAITLGTGVGTGIVLGGKVYRSTTGGSEWGHIMMSLDGSYKCGCGNMGCIETYCSATALVYLARDSGMNNIASARDVCLLAEEDDALALSVLDKYSRFLAIALYNYIIILNPEMIVLGGGLSTSARLFLPKAKQYLKTFLHEREDIKPVEIVATSFPDQAGIIGAAYLCMEHKRIAV